MKKQSRLHFLLTLTITGQFLFAPIIGAYAEDSDSVTITTSSTVDTTDTADKTADTKVETSTTTDETKPATTTNESKTPQHLTRVSSINQNSTSNSNNGKGKAIVKYQAKSAHKKENFIWSGMLMLTMPIIAVMSIQSITPNDTCYSPWIFSASAVYYGVKEAMNWKEFKGGSEEALAIIRGEDKDLQLKTLEQAKEETARAKKAINNKVQNVKVAAVGFGVAAAVALVEAMYESTPMGWARGCKSISSTRHSSIEDVQYAQTEINQLEQLFNTKSFYLTKKISAHSGQDKLSTLISFLEQGNQYHSITTESYQEILHTPTASLLPNSEILVSILNNAVNLMFPPVKAAMTKYERFGIIGGAGLALLIQMQEFQWVKNQLNMFNGYSRSAWYAGASYIGFQAYDEFKDVLNDLKDREKKYDSLIHLLANTNKVNSMELNGSIRYSNRTNAPILPDPLKNTNNGNDDLCIAGGNAAAKPISCKRCNAINKCKKSEIPGNTKFPADFPKDLAQATNLMKNMQNERYKGNTSAATLAENKLGHYAAKIQKINKQLQDLANAKRVANGKKPIDFNSLSNKLMKKYQKSALAAINKLPSNYQTAFQELGGTNLKKSKVHDYNGTKRYAKSQSTHRISPTSKNDGKKGDGLADLDFGLDEENSEDTSDASTGLAANEEYDYGASKDDISMHKDTNIFKIITLRYLKSAYPVLLEEE